MVLPVAILLVSVFLAAYFYRLLPAEVAYHFTNGSPDSWMSRGAIIAWMIVPQFVLVLAALVVILSTAIMGTRLGLAESPPVAKLLPLIGNMVALPQIILTFAMLDIFLYNAYQIHLISLWVFILGIMVLGGIILGVFFIQVLRQVRELPGNNLQE
jgi:hypothetical protein